MVIFVTEYGSLHDEYGLPVSCATCYDENATHGEDLDPCCDTCCSC